MDLNLTVYGVSREPGGAELISLIVKSKPLIKSVLIGKDYACDVYKKHNLNFLRYQGASIEAFFSFLEELHRGASDCIVLTSAASLPEQDLTERHAWSWARKNGIQSVAVLDQWQNYGKRFNGLDDSSFSKSLPTRICVMDESAKVALIREGFPAGKIVVTGHPSLARLKRITSSPSAEPAGKLRKHLSCNKDDLLMLFISEPFSKTLGEDIGFTEIDILEGLLDYMSGRPDPDKCLTRDGSITLAIKLHPKNNYDSFERLKKKHRRLWRRLKIRTLRNEYDKTELLKSSDIIVGMSSIMLMESIASGKTTVSVQLDARHTDWCEAVNQGIIPLITSKPELKRVMNGLLDEKGFSAKYLEAIRRYPIITDAEKRIWTTIHEIQSLQSPEATGSANILKRSIYGKTCA